MSARVRRDGGGRDGLKKMPGNRVQWTGIWPVR